MRKYFFAATAFICLEASALANQEPPSFDGQYHPAIEGTYSFECRTVRVALRYRQERVPLERVSSLQETLRVTLLDLSVMGRNLPPSDLEAGREVFSSFAWVHRIDATCYGDELTIGVNGMPLIPFIASIDNRTETPELRTRTIRLSESGIAETS